MAGAKQNDIRRQSEQRALERWRDNGRPGQSRSSQARDAEGKGQDSATGVTGIPTDLTGAELFSRTQETQLTVICSPGVHRPAGHYNLSL